MERLLVIVLLYLFGVSVAAGIFISQRRYRRRESPTHMITGIVLCLLWPGALAAWVVRG